jgi:hypothetical protein
LLRLETRSALFFLPMLALLLAARPAGTNDLPPAAAGLTRVFIDVCEMDGPPGHRITVLSRTTAMVVDAGAAGAPAPPPRSPAT